MINEENKSENKEKEIVKKLLKQIQGHAKKEMGLAKPEFGRFLLRVIADDNTRVFVNKLIEKG